MNMSFNIERPFFTKVDRSPVSGLRVVHKKQKNVRAQTFKIGEIHPLQSTTLACEIRANQRLPLRLTPRNEELPYARDDALAPPLP